MNIVLASPHVIGLFAGLESLLNARQVGQLLFAQEQPRLTGALRQLHLGSDDLNFCHGHFFVGLDGVRCASLFGQLWASYLRQRRGKLSGKGPWLGFVILSQLVDEAEVTLLVAKQVLAVIDNFELLHRDLRDYIDSLVFRL